ncbi:MAG: DegT/DnrJ/EryC1/StrS family aminotransferase [Nitrospirae bacterium]|nr:DegT/DnrJ/EryC1/StrS family aminotransferase [Nitrospirota bacterium]MCL5976741.1 DegT/DnrJ/EryC1/StrS family aminotransferase [Nitrospirota bacterium]
MYISDIVPFVDLKSQWAEIEEEALPMVRKLLQRGELIGGYEVYSFEEEFANYIGAKHCIALSSGTAALHYALRAMGVGNGDEVITAANTFIATAEAIVLAGATPVLVDITDDGIHPSVENFIHAITEKTKALIPVHLYGFPMDLTGLYEFIKNKNIRILEDACQAHGAKINGRIIGKDCDAAAFSFYPSKNLGACGDAGAIVTNDDILASDLRMLRNHGSIKKYEHHLIGSTERMDVIQACILRKKLTKLDDWNKRRREIAQYYTDNLADIKGIWFPKESLNAEACYHLFVVHYEKRDELAQELNKNGIETGFHYPLPIHLMKPFSFLGKNHNSFPNAEKKCKSTLSLPIGPHLTISQAKKVSEAVRFFVEGK